MTSLDAYLRDEYQVDKQQLWRTQEVVRSVAPLFVKYQTEYKNRIKTWPYRIVNGKASKLKTLSDSTHCMIAFALDAILQGASLSTHSAEASSVLYPKSVRGLKIEIDDLRKVVLDAKRGFFEILLTRTEPVVNSSTFGSDDPFTLTWLAELLYRYRVTDEDVASETIQECKAKVCKAARQVCRRGKHVLMLKASGSGPRHDEIPHCFQMLRCLHLAKAAGRIGTPETQMLKLKDVTPQIFEDHVYQQLGFFSIPDSRFDPAVLVFAMEGVLQFDAGSLSDSTIELVVQTLESSQKRNPYWRPVTPFLSDSQGMVLFPVSVEVCNSLLRCVDLLLTAQRPTYVHSVESLLRRYVQWLLARAERIDDGSGHLIGWHSEHVNEPGLIHLWETSQVLLFLVHYSSLLQRKIASDGLKYASLTVRRWESIKKIPNYWNAEPLTALAKAGDRKYAALQRIHDDFLLTRSARSLLLYGPAGTGKTTVAEQMAVQLKQPLVTITVSDFLAQAADEVEARAKGIFQVLEEQTDVIILFDEIDQFLLDRNSDRYADQTGIFQFLTPGMLTKFQNLKDLGWSIFIVATNYEERIDSAIKRQGRFDHRLLLSLPDKTRRTEFLWGFMCDRVARIVNDKEALERFRAYAKSNDQRKLVKNICNKDLKADFKVKDAFRSRVSEDLVGRTKLFGWGDLKYLVNTATQIEAGATWETIINDLVKAASTVEPAVRLAAYKKRFGTSDPSPYEELGVLLYIVGEANEDVDGSDRDWMYANEDTFGGLIDHIRGSSDVKMKVWKKMPKSVKGFIRKPRDTGNGATLNR